MAESCIVSFEPTESNDTAVLVIGKRINGGLTKVVNAFQGKEAIDLWNNLTNENKRRKYEKKDIHNQWDGKMR